MFLLLGEQLSILLADVYQGGCCQGFAASALFAVAIKPVNLSIMVCVQACTRGTIFPMDALDIPPPPTRQVHLKPMSVNHTIHIPNLSFLHPAHPHDTHTVPFLFIILLLCNCLDDNALHIMAKHGTINEPSGDNLFTFATPCPAKYQ